jgi:hypothetical protein
MENGNDIVVGECNAPQKEKSCVSFGWNFASLLLGYILWDRFNVLFGFGLDKANFCILTGCLLMLTVPIWQMWLTKTHVARKGTVFVIMSAVLLFLFFYTCGAWVYARYWQAHDMAEYAQKFISERCALQTCNKPDDAGLVEIGTLQVMVTEHDMVQHHLVKLGKVQAEIAGLIDLDEKVRRGKPEVKITKIVQDVETAVVAAKAWERDDYRLLRRVIHFSPLVCEVSNQPIVGSHMTLDAVSANSSPSKISLVCRPQVMLDYGKSLPQAYPLFTWVLEKAGLLPLKA